MKTRSVLLLLTMVSLLAVGIAFPKPPGALGPPELLSIVETTATIGGLEDVAVILLDWTDVGGAGKYSVNITATATYDTGEVDEDENPILAEVVVETSFGTSDRLDGYPMEQSDLNIPVSDIEDIELALEVALADALEAAGLPPDTEAEVEPLAKVKALNPNDKPTARQNNPSSNALLLP